jgi:hypothetical protein
MACLLCSASPVRACCGLPHPAGPSQQCRQVSLDGLQPGGKVGLCLQLAQEGTVGVRVVALRACERTCTKKEGR